jgi:hypothetical protein
MQLQRKTSAGFVFKYTLSSFRHANQNSVYARPSYFASPSEMINDKPERFKRSTLYTCTFHIYRVYSRNEISSVSSMGHPKRDFPFGRSLAFIGSSPATECILMGFFLLFCLLVAQC